MRCMASKSVLAFTAELLAWNKPQCCTCISQGLVSKHKAVKIQHRKIKILMLLHPLRHWEREMVLCLQRWPVAHKNTSPAFPWVYCTMFCVQFTSLCIHAGTGSITCNLCSLLGLCLFKISFIAHSGKDLSPTMCLYSSEHTRLGFLLGPLDAFVI